MTNRVERVIVDPAVAEAEEAFNQMMAWFRSMTPEEYLQFGIEHGLLNADGTHRLPEGDPCVSG